MVRPSKAPKKNHGRVPYSCVKVVLVSVITGLSLLNYGLMRTHTVVQKDGNDSSVVSPKNEKGQRPFRKPTFDSVVQGWNITGDVNWMLDFAIVGFPKTGTSTLMVYLSNQSQSISMPTKERCELGYNQHVVLLRDEMYHRYRPRLKLGIKCPRDLEVDLALENYNKFFPKTKFIVGVRQPILWFESLYNMRVQNSFNMPDASRLIGKCKKAYNGVCTKRANFSEHLEKIEPWREVFLYDVSQLKDSNAAREALFRSDLQNFLELKQPLEQNMIHVKPGRAPVSEEHAVEIANQKIDICDDKYSDLRKVLLEQGSNSANWIENVFLKNPKVHASSPEYLLEKLAEWHHDPCEQRAPAT
jgi:hypothetical protein